MTEPEGPRDVEYGLVMPFVNVKSKGGEHDDDAFVAGYECGHLDRHLQELARLSSRTVQNSTVHSSNLDQLDLIAMNRGFTMERGEVYEEWTLVTFRRTADA